MRRSWCALLVFQQLTYQARHPLPVNNNYKPVPRLEIYDTKLVKRSLGGLNSAKKRSRTTKAHYLYL